VLALIFLASVPTEAGTLHGTVTNRTTGKAAAGVEVVLIQLQNGMQPVGNTKTDPQGQFTMDNPGIGAQPMLVRAIFRGVNFHQALPAGKSEIQLDVFEPTTDPKTIDVLNHIVALQPNGTTLIVGEEYSVRNSSNPPVAYFRANGNFEFAAPEGAQLQQVSAWGPSGMPTVQASIDKNNNRYAVAFAFRPGESGIRYSYQVPYEGNSAAVKLPTVYPGAKLLVVAPPSVQISGDGLQPSGQEQGMTVYAHDGPLAPKALFALNISGTAPPASAASGGMPSGTQGQDPQPAGAGVANVQSIPGRLDSLMWPLIVGFLGLFALGAMLLARRPVAAVAGGVPSDAPRNPSGAHPDKARHPGVPAANSTSSPLAEIDSAVGLNLETLKDQIFRLELRRQAGTISDADYAQQRARAEKVLRDLVKG
jgi:hypothetical protein